MDVLPIFDIDGVITNPYTKIPHPKIVQYIADRLNANKIVAIATGRSVGWITERILPEIEKRLLSLNKFNNLFISSEKGAIVLHFLEGEFYTEVDKNIQFPIEIMTEVREKVKDIQGIFYDDKKLTMVSVEIEAGKNMQEVKEEVREIERVEAWMREVFLPKYDDIIIERSEISVDIQNKHVNKKMAAKKFLGFLKEKNITPSDFIMFGDSPSDAHVIEEMSMHGYAGVFAYVGKKPLAKTYSFPVRTPSENIFFDDGAALLLEKIKE
ncbi:MAG: HAD-IIB family hydrolase [Candidatus Levyibacteriota bacterium]